MEKRVRWMAACLLGCALLVILWKANEKGLSHDEHQFVSPGLLTLERGLLPYRDYPLFHVPNLVFIHAAVACFAGHKLLALRLFTGVCVWVNVWLLGRFATRAFSGERAGLRLGLVTAAVVLWMASPVFGYTVRFIWNHGTPTLVVCAAFLVHLGALEGNRPWRLGLSGLLLALAVGMRLTIAPLAAPFGLALLLLPAWPWSRRAAGLGWFALGLTVGALPLLYFLAVAREQFLFCNLESARFAKVWRAFPFWHGDLSSVVDPAEGFLLEGSQQAGGRGFEGKWVAFFHRSVLKNWAAFAAALLLGLPGAWCALRAGGGDRRRVALVLGCLPFVAWGCLAPTRFNRQYPYLLVFFLLLLTVAGVAALLRTRARWPALGLFLLLTVGALLGGWGDYRGMKGVYKMHQWATVAAGRRAWEFRAKVPGAGRMLTFDTLIAQEAGLEVYPEFVSGQFPWRLAHLLPAEDRARFHVVGPADLEALLQKHPPESILLGDDPKMVEPLADYARAHGFRLRDEKRGLWVAPPPPTQ